MQQTICQSKILPGTNNQPLTRKLVKIRAKNGKIIAWGVKKQIEDLNIFQKVLI